MTGEIIERFGKLFSYEIAVKKVCTLSYRNEP